jgi:hypothetical protein
MAIKKTHTHTTFQFSISIQLLHQATQNYGLIMASPVQSVPNLQMSLHIMCLLFKTYRPLWLYTPQRQNYQTTSMDHNGVPQRNDACDRCDQANQCNITRVNKTNVFLPHSRKRVLYKDNFMARKIDYRLWVTRYGQCSQFRRTNWFYFIR